MTEIANPSPRRYLAVQSDRGKNPRTLGEVSLDADSMLTVLRAEPGQQAALERVVKDMNGSTALSVKVPPPPDAPPHAVASRRVARGDPEFPSVLRDQLRTYYDVELHPHPRPGA